MSVSYYQKDCFRNYKESIGYDDKYKYLYGNPINVLVPIETTLNKFMIVGAYPSAKFYTVDNILDTPLYDNDSPFSNESYFDGIRARTIPSGQELNEVILSQLGIKRNECWITDLVKVFLFKDGHIKRYKKLRKIDFEENRSQFDKYAQSSLAWLKTEIEISNPKLIILLGVEVAKNVLKISEIKAKESMNGNIITKIIDDVERKFICVPHPGILMKKFDRNPWPERFEKVIAPKVRIVVTYIKKTF